ncbi:HesA/MoeB/ThiF family protein [Kozakia baliensis]|uniref:HesA/MoeB/ThiF family protein n=1 Tax=Kozakia baliensis TaxID=153496 RepID=UPI000495B1B1|nr:HesA/MoeB/ThiF family protein [Kozakia baliensis]
MSFYDPDLDFNDDALQRYSRHILLPEIGAIGQARLGKASVLVIGAGGLGSPIALYLAAAGIGRIGLIDDDIVDLSNLQRQILFESSQIGTAKVEAARERLEGLNPLVKIEPHLLHADATVLDDLVARYDLVCDGSDNFATRQAVSDACVRQKRSLVSGAVARFEGQLSTFRPHLGGPCYRCLYPDAAAEDAPTCGQAGIFGAVTGVIGTLAATEVLKEILGIGRSLDGRVLCWDALETSFRSFALVRDPHCPSCKDLHR